jgi:hypothetical protein
LKLGNYSLTLAVLSLLIFVARADAQVKPTATQELRLSAFGLANGTYSGLGSGYNAGITGGVDLGVHLFYRYLPSFEVRGTYPFYRGDTASAKNILGGFKLERPFGRYRPYVDALFGRAEINYANGGIANPTETFRYTKSPSYVYLVGGGVDVNLTRHFAAKADAQLERYATPVADSGHLLSPQVSVGVVYKFDFTGHSYYSR